MGGVVWKKEAQVTKVWEVLVAAKQLLIDKGWIQGSLGHESVGFCAQGAIEAAIPYVDHGDGSSCLQCRSKYLFQEVTGGIVSFNDEPGRTKEEVLAKFDEAIALAEKGATNG